MIQIALIKRRFNLCLILFNFKISFFLFARQKERNLEQRKKKHAIVYYILTTFGCSFKFGYAESLTLTIIAAQHVRGTNANDNEPSPLLPQVTIGLVIVRVYPQQPFNLCPQGIGNICVLFFLLLA
jgi:hypothetical protein